MARVGRRGMPVESSDGKRYVSVMEAARAIVAEYGCGNADYIHANILQAMRRGGTAYEREWRYLVECAGCEYARVPSVCPNHWSWPEYPADACRLRKEDE